MVNRQTGYRTALVSDYHRYAVEPYTIERSSSPFQILALAFCSVAGKDHAFVNIAGSLHDARDVLAAHDWYIQNGCFEDYVLGKRLGECARAAFCEGGLPVACRALNLCGSVVAAHPITSCFRSLVLRSTEGATDEP